MRWRVAWWVFTGNWREHNWLGRDVKKKLKRLDPPRRVAEFATQAEAEGLRQKLRERYGENVVVDITRPRQAPQTRPIQQRLPGDWPLQRPDER
jgi:hypothetical protein